MVGAKATKKYVTTSCLEGTEIVVETSCGPITIVLVDTAGQELNRKQGYDPMNDQNPFKYNGGIDSVLLVFEYEANQSLTNLSKAVAVMKRAFHENSEMISTNASKGGGLKKVPVAILGNKCDVQPLKIKAKSIRLPFKEGLPFWQCSVWEGTAFKGGCYKSKMEDEPVVKAAFADPLRYILRHLTGHEDLEIVA